MEPADKSRQPKHFKLGCLPRVIRFKMSKNDTAKRPHCRGANYARMMLACPHREEQLCWK